MIARAARLTLAAPLFTYRVGPPETYQQGFVMRVNPFVAGVVVCLALPAGALADTLQGVVKDEHGQPVVGARVDIATAQPKVGRGVICPSCYLDCKKWARTDENGRFEITGVDPKLNFRVLTTAPGKGTHLTDYVNPSAKALELTLFDFPTDIAPRRLIRGVLVRDGDVPVPGALLEPFGYKSSSISSFGIVQAQPAVSDEHGRFQIPLSSDYDEVYVRITADELAGTTLTLKPGEETRIVVPAGTAVTGRLVYQGRPQPQQTIAVVQTKRLASTHFIKSVLAVTDRDGRFAFQALPASQQYAIFTPVGDGGGAASLGPGELVLSTKTFEARGDGETRDLGSLEMIRGLTLSGRIELPEGHGAPADWKLSLSRDPAWDLIEVPVDGDCRFAIFNLPPETYHVYVAAAGLRPDLTRLNFQGTRRNSFGVRLTESLQDLAIPLVADAPPAPQARAQAAEAETPANVAPVSGKGPAARAARPPVVLRDEPIPEDAPKLNVHGTVVSPTGERLAGVEVALVADVGGSLAAISPLQAGDVLARTATDAHGRFVFSNVPLPPRMREAIAELTAGTDGGRLGSIGARVLAAQPGRGLAWAEVSALDAPEPLRIVLGPGVAVAGKIVDAAGRGVPRARVEIETIAPVAATLLLRQRTAELLQLSTSDFEHSAVADLQGEFVLPNLPANRHVLVQIHAPGFEWQRVVFNTTTGAAPPEFADVSFDQLSAPVQKSPVQVDLKPAGQVAVRVVDAAGQPVLDGAVRTLETNRRSGSQPIGLAPDGQALVPVKYTGAYTVSYLCEPLRPRLGISFTQDLSSDQPNAPLTMRLPAPRWLTGRVVSAETGAPVVGARVRFTQTDAPEPIASATCVSGANGEFRLPATSGRGRLALVQSLHGYYVASFAALKPDAPGVDVVVPETGDIPPVTLPFTPGLVIEGTVVDAAGKPVRNQLVRVEGTETSFYPLAARTDSQGRFRLAGMPPFAAVLVSATAGGAAAEAVIPGAPQLGDLDLRRERVSLTLLPGVQLSGRVLKQGQPLAGARVEVRRSRPATGERSRVFAVVTTDKDGRYLVGGFEPGDSYQLQITASDGSLAVGGPQVGPFPQTIPADQMGVLQLPDVSVVGAQQSLAGIVVDREGNPVADVQIVVRLANGEPIPRRDAEARASLSTGPSGRFRLDKLPDEPLQLTAFVRPPRQAAPGTPIRFPAELQPALNQTDIRLVLDARLADPVESLDSP